MFLVSDSAREREGWRANEKGLGHRRPRTFAPASRRTLTEGKYESAGEGASGQAALTLARSAAPDVELPKNETSLSKFWATSQFLVALAYGKYFDYSKVKFRCHQATVAFLLLVFFGAY